MLEVQQLKKHFPTRAEDLHVLRGVDLSLQPGDALAITGPSGSGKSTLLHILGTLERPSSGNILLEGTDPFALDEQGLARFRNQKVGFIFQDHHLLPPLNVLQNVLLPTLAQEQFPATSATPTDYPERARKLLNDVGLGERLEHTPAELSGGERQRAAVARALLLQPALVLADEPTGNLDRANAEAIGELLLSLPRASGAILIVVTHSRELAEKFPKQMRMEEGHLLPVLAEIQRPFNTGK